MTESVAGTTIIYMEMKYGQLLKKKPNKNKHKK
jgi:hypothetical protein